MQTNEELIVELAELQVRLDIATDLLIEVRPDISIKELAVRVDDWLGFEDGILIEGLMQGKYNV